MDTKKTEKYVIGTLEKFYKWGNIPAQLVLTIIVSLIFLLIIGGSIAIAIIFHLSLLFFLFTLAALTIALSFPTIFLLNFYGKKVLKPETAQRLIMICWATISFFISIPLLALGIASLRSNITTGVSIIAAGLLFLGIFVWVMWVSRRISSKEKLSWAAEPSKLTFFKGMISNNYTKNLLASEMIMFIVAIAGFVLRHFSKSIIMDQFTLIPIYLGLGGMLLAPVWCLCIPPKKFLLITNQAELKGTLASDEKFLGAVFGTKLLSTRPHAAVEDTDNSIFITNKHFFSITIPKIVFLSQPKTPFYKTQYFEYLQKKGDELLKKTPKEVLFSHNYNFSIPFEQIIKIKIISNILFKTIGLNLVVVNTIDGNFIFSAYYPDQFEKLTTLLKKVAPGKIIEKIFF